MKLIFRNQLYFHTQKGSDRKRNYENNAICNSIKKNEIPRNKVIQENTKLVF